MSDTPAPAENDGNDQPGGATAYRPLGLMEARVLGVAIIAADGGHRVTRRTDAGETVTGVALQVVAGPDNSRSLDVREDVRDSYLEVQQGNDIHRWPLRELVPEYYGNRFTVHIGQKGGGADDPPHHGPHHGRHRG